MKTIKALSLFVILSALSLAQMVTLTQTTTTAAVTATQRIIPVTSATGINAPSLSAGVTGSALYIVDPGSPGELVRVVSVSGTNITVTRTGTNKAVAHVSGALVMIGNPDHFYNSDPWGACTTANTRVAPWVNVNTGANWLCSTVSLAWVPSWQNPSAAISATLTVASAASAILPSGPLFTVSGTAAVTGFTTPIGFVTGSFSVIPTGAFTWTTAGNIGLAGTAVVGRVLTFTWDASASKWYPSYV